MGWYNDNLQQYNNAQTKYTANEMFNGGTGPGTEALSYKTNLGGKDYYYAPKQTIIGNRIGQKTWDDSTAKSLGGVDWTRQIYNDPGAGARGSTLNYGPNTSATPTTEQGYLFENDPNAGKNVEYKGLSNSSWWRDQGLGLAAIAAAPFAVSAGLGAAGSNTAAPIAGGGSASLSAPTAGGALTGGGAGTTGTAALTAPTVGVNGYMGGTTGTGMLGGSIPAYTPAMDAAGMGAGGYSSIANGAGSTLGATGGGSSMFSGIGDMFSNLSGGQKLGLGMSVADMAMRYNQQQELKDIAEKSGRMSNPLNDPQRQQYQQLLSQYLNGGQDITQQPIVKSEMDAMKRAAEAQMAKAGMTGSGNAGNIMSDYMLEAMNRTSQPYLNFLAGAGGFNGSGSNGNIYGTLASQGTSAPFQGMNSMGQAFSNLMPQEAPWWSSAYNAQQQMMGRGNNSNFYGIA